MLANKLGDATQSFVVFTANLGDYRSTLTTTLGG
jgi:hypothetical protein